MAMEPQFTIPQNPECVRNPDSKIPTRIPDYPNNRLKSMVCGTIRNPERSGFSKYVNKNNKLRQNTESGFSYPKGCVPTAKAWAHY